MSERINTWLQRLWSHWGVAAETVALGQCVHYCGFRYGRGEYNPYETYLHDLVRTGNVAAARARFVDFLQHYRPRNFAEALGVELNRPGALWFYPWVRHAPPPAWCENPADCPDILTHFSARGIPRPRIEEEFGWLERALDSIRTHGYEPRKFRSSILARKLIREDGATAYLLQDGNHRLAALSALGRRDATVCCPPWLAVRESELLHWPQVRRGVYSADDARRVFRVHFQGNHRPRTTPFAAEILEAES